MQNKAVRFPTRNARDLSEYKEGGTMNALGQPQVLHEHSLSQALWPMRIVLSLFSAYL